MKIIQRRCFNCRILKDRSEMLKITLQGGELFLNPDSKTTGRSVYVCKNEECIKNFIKKRGIKRGLKFNNDKEILKIEKLLTDQI